MTVYVFDMDGTLTQVRKPMDEEYASRFNAFQKLNKTFIATGSDYDKVEEQLISPVIDDLTGAYCSMGNVLIEQNKIIYQNVFILEEDLKNRLLEFRNNTQYPGPFYDNHTEIRNGMVNFSVLGRNCTKDARLKYFEWDNEHGERIMIQKLLTREFPKLDTTIGGQISVDITFKGWGKGQIAHDLRRRYPNEKIVFFGDKTMPGGNDYELAQELLKMENTEVVQVNSPQDTLIHLGI